MRAKIEWAQRNPIGLLLLFTVIATFVYFFGWLHLFTNGRLSTWTSAWQAWNPETNYEHAKIIPLTVASLIWCERDKLKNAQVESSRCGWRFITMRLFPFLSVSRPCQR